MSSLRLYLNILREISLLTRDDRFAIIYALAYYLIIRMRRLLSESLEWKTLSDDLVKNITERLSSFQENYIDYSCCLLGNVKDGKPSAPAWAYVCSKETTKKYKLLVLPFEDVKENTILMSETVKYNLGNSLRVSEIDKNCFLLWIKEEVPTFAQEAKVSLVTGPHEIANDLAETLLKNYFSLPRFLRPNDLFCVNTKEYAPEQTYLLNNPSLNFVYFKVNSVKVPGGGHFDGAYIVHGETSLLQESNVHGYLPARKFASVQDEFFGKTYLRKCPPSLVQSLRQLEDCISPFIKKDVRLRIKPIFLVKGGHGTGKRRLVRILAERMGLHLLTVEFAEVQTLTSAQTEAKLRIVVNNARQCTPCVLCLNNIEVFGKNSEGQKDERIISAFATELNSLYSKELEYPLVVVATCDESDLPAELNRLFIETIKIDRMDQSMRASSISWLLGEKGLSGELNASKIAGICSDFRLSDFEALLSHAAKTRCKSRDSEKIHLEQEDFEKAYEYMQSIFTDGKGAPRVPKVHWEDIGGLAELKQEIIRRIQLPLLSAYGFGQSGLLLYGPPGTGKTLLAKAVATEYQLHFLSVKGPEVLNMYVGQSEKNVRQVFERARAAAPCIIFFDELDSLAPNRGRSGDSGGVMDRVVSQLLAEMDGLESSSSIFIIGATNRPDLIDPALLRPGRFDKMLYVGIHSDRHSQLSVLKALTRKFQLERNGEELEELLDHLPVHTTGADLYSICSDAWLAAARNVLQEHIDGQDATGESKLSGSISVGLRDFTRAAQELVPSVTEEEARRYERMQRELSSVS